MSKILVVDDDNDMCNLLNRFLTKNGYQVMEARTGKKALEAMSTSMPDLVLCDYKMEGMSGAELLSKIKAIDFNIPVIIITGYSDIKIAVEIMKNGAYDYVTKPLYPEEILVTIKTALANKGTGATSVPIAKAYSLTPATGDYIFGNSPVFQEILKQIALVAPTNYSVIIYGETGSGKEVIANEIHQQSRRNKKPFIAVDCGAMSKELAGSELFGHEKGSFTGAFEQKTGIFEMANGGTVFMDEIANLSYDIQVSLLRVIQERKMRRVGGNKDIVLDVRIIVASNEKLWDMASRNKFREDLFHRFNEFSIEVPPLRSRGNDIMIFASHFLKQANKELGKNIKGFNKEVQDIFHKYIWYGNLRELKNVIKRATLLTDGEEVSTNSLPFEIINYNKLQFDVEIENKISDKENIPVSLPEENKMIQPVEEPHVAETSIKKNSLKSVAVSAEFETIMQALKQTNYNKSKAARILKIDRKTLYNKMSLHKEFTN